MSRIQKPRGTQDMIGEQVARFDHVVDTFNRVRKLYGFGRIEVPVFEETEVFARGMGETTDVVSKEMYSFDDRSGDSLTLRPEFTAGICRAFIENGWTYLAPVKAATWGPLFRYERPQKGRFRQFHQIDAEIIGAAEASVDDELITMAQHLLNELGIAEFVKLQLNTMGDEETREQWSHAVADHFRPYRDKLSDDSKRRFSVNPLRILDSKDLKDREIASGAPQIADFMTDSARRFYDSLRQGLMSNGVVWDENPFLVRGLDYYRHTVFEFVTSALGSQGTVIGGGRYDGLVGFMGGPETPAVGWAGGIERLAMLVGAPDVAPVIAVVPDVPEMGDAAATILRALRGAGMAAEMAYRGNAKRQIEIAKKRESAAIVFVRADGSRNIQHLRGDEAECAALAAKIAAVTA